MTQDEIICMARELVKTHGLRMCDEDGNTHGEELYCVGVEDIAEIIKQVAAHEREACAKVCENLYKHLNYDADCQKLWPHTKMINDQYAAAIRARCQK